MKLFILTFFISLYCSSQNFEVEYVYRINYINDLTSENKKFLLNQNSENSIFSLVDLKDIKNFKHSNAVSLMKQNDTISLFSINDNIMLLLDEEKTYKNFKSYTQISTHLLQFKHEYVKDRTDMFNWEILNEKDTIIGDYTCKKAKTKFRGREYIACFSADVANQGGPWKFDGLPGFILAIKSLDGFVSFEPSIIRFSKKNKTIENPFINKKTIAFEHLKDKELEARKMFFAKLKSNPNPPTSYTISKYVGIEDIGVGESTMD